jgi:uncharacterized protein YggE
MNRALRVTLFVLLGSTSLLAQAPEVKFIADTLVVQADGTYEADPDLATLTFQIFSQDTEIKKAYDTAAQSVQKIADIAQKNGLKKEDITTGVLRVAPIYGGDRKKKVRSYYVQGQVILKVRDFSHIGAILDGSVQDGVTDFRSLTYSLSDEEAAKKEAVAQAMRRAMGRASIALEQKGQKLGTLRYMSLDVKQLFGVAQMETYDYFNREDIAGNEGSSGFFSRKKTAAPPPPPPPVAHPQKISVTASVQSAFQIQ